MSMAKKELPSSSEMTQAMLEEADREGGSKGSPAASNNKRELPYVDRGRLYLTSGVVAVAKRMSPTRLLAAMNRWPRPTPPTTYHETLQREIENPDDPDYIERVKEYKGKMAEALLNVMLIYGVEIIEVPDDIPQIQSNDWVDRIRATGEPVDPENVWWRQLNYFHDVAAPLDLDHTLIQEEVGRLNGITQNDANTAANFPGSETD